MSYHNDNNLPHGFDDTGIKVHYSGCASGNNSEREFKRKMQYYPSDFNMADRWLNCIRKFGDVINERALERMRKEGIIS